jgi:hypothetical protein
MECPSCGTKAFLVELTAEDIQRVRPPTMGMVCEDCREKYRSAARLEIRYSTWTALRDLALMVLVGVSLLLFVLDAFSSYKLAVSVGRSNVVFFVTAATSLTGLKMIYSELSGRYGFTHNLSWSLHSRYAILSIAVLVSGILAAAVSPFVIR